MWASRDEQLIQFGMFPSSYKQIETAFTFSVLDDFLTDNLECKTTAQQYYSKLQSITNCMFPGSVSVCSHFFPRQCLIFNVLVSLCRIYTSNSSGLLVNGVICRVKWIVGLHIMMMNIPGMDQWQCSVQHTPARPDDWKTRYTKYEFTSWNWSHYELCCSKQLIQTFIMDGNFSAEHMRCREGEAEALLAAEMAFMANPNSFNTHLLSGQEYSQVCGFTRCHLWWLKPCLIEVCKVLFFNLLR